MPLELLHNKTKKLRNRHYLIIDFIILVLCPFWAVLIRFDWIFDNNVFLNPIIHYIVLFLPIKFGIFYILGLYKRYWPAASIDDLARIVLIGANILIVQLFTFGIIKSYALFGFKSLPNSIPILDGMLTTILISSFRFSVRILERANERLPKKKTKENVLIIGAGDAGIMVVQELHRNSQLKQKPVAFIDDDKSKHGLKIRSLPVIGDRSRIVKSVKDFNITKIIIAMPTAPGATIKEIVAICSKTDAEVMTLPGIYEILNGRVRIESLRKVQIEDLLRREPVEIDKTNVDKFLKDKVVLITGAGGSIGSELCRQILNSNPALMLLLGHGENSIFEIEQELNLRKNRINGKNRTDIITRIGDIRDRVRLDEIFSEFKPDIIFHAAAHKHVPLMELNCTEAVSNNVLGTKNLVDLSMLYGISNFILISSDKAVNPTNIMGTTKRVGEILLLDAARKTNNNYSVVRFGNVLGSRGSVVHTFNRQIANGGPITITSPDITRYFMTIPEAVQLVLQAAVLGNGGNVFILNMGEPIKIIDLAKDLIKLSGLSEGKDIEIKCTGLRPGEKLFEELFVTGECVINTEHEKIQKVVNAIEFLPERLDHKIYNLLFRKCTSKAEVIEKLQAIVPTYEPVVDEQTIFDNKYINYKVMD